jgi:hypothetical protein
MEVLKYSDFVNEKFLFGDIATINIRYIVIGHDHYLDRLNRTDNDDGRVISQSDVESDIAQAIKIIGRRNLFQAGISWNGDTLDTEILIRNSKTHLNTILIVRKIEIYNNSYQYELSIKTVIIRKNFYISDKTSKTLEIVI